MRIAPKNSAALFGLSLAAVLLVLPQSAWAISGAYMQLGVGYGKLSGSNLYVSKMGNDLPIPGDAGLPSGGPVLNFRLGYSIFGFGGPEFGIIGHGWDLGSSTGGAGFVGGGLRAYPLAFISLLGLDTADFPIDISIAGLFGWTIMGKDFAYTGSFLDIDLTLEYRFTDWASVGLRIDYIKPTYSDFVYTSYKNNEGRCLDSSGDQVAGPDNKPVANGNDTVVKKGTITCNGSGPPTTLIAPQLVITLHWDLFE